LIAIDYVLYTLGELQQYSSFIANQRPNTRIIDRKTNTLVETVLKDTPDQFMIQGTLTSGALLSFHLRGGKPFPPGPQFLWRIYGEKGEIEVTASGALLNVGYDDTKVLLHDQLTGQVETIEIAKDEWDDLPLQAKNIARLYEAFRKGESEGVVDFESTVRRHALIEDIYEHWDSGNQGRSL
jgi:predicted dehydrogenase